MKKLTSLFIILFSYLRPVHASLPDTVPNPGFERWVFSMWDLNPDLWFTSNSELLAPTVVIDSNSFSGFTAMKLIYQGNIIPTAWCGFPLSNHPQNFGGYMKDLLNTNDSVTISARIFYNQTLVDSGYSVVYGGINPNYIPFVVPISQFSASADSCVIFITGCNTWGSEITFDDVQFDFQTGISNRIIPRLKFYPNPCMEHLVVEMENPGDSPLILTVYDLAGRLCDNSVYFEYLDFEKIAVKPGYAKCYINTSLLSKGCWIIGLQNNHVSNYIRIIRE